MRFLDALQNAKSDNKNIVIPDIKCYSPKEGDLMCGRDPVEYAKMLCEAGAPVLSVVTESEEFHGSLKMLKDIALEVDVPILRKDFIHTKDELIQTVEAGASAILLMCSCLEKEELKTLYNQAIELGLDPFVETHKEEDFELVNDLNAKLVGINNRDILILEKDDGNVDHTCMLASLAPQDSFLITESSIVNASQIRKAIASGVDAALVGTAILTAKNTKEFYQMLCSKVSLKICGLMNQEDIELCMASGVERMGLVTEYPVEVPWNLTLEKACELRKYISKGYEAVMVAGGSIQDIYQLACKVKPDYVQIHYNETIEHTKELVMQLHDIGIGAIGILPDKLQEQMRQDANNFETLLQSYIDTGIDEILIDPRNSGNAKQENLKADIELFNKVKSYSTVPVILAGGIDSDNVKKRLLQTGALAVDIMSGSENSPGHKSKEKIEKIIFDIRSR